MTAYFVAAYSGEAFRIPVAGINAASREVHRCMLRVAEMKDGVYLRSLELHCLEL